MRYGRNFNDDDDRHGLLLHASQQVLPAVEKLTLCSAYHVCRLRLLIGLFLTQCCLPLQRKPAARSFSAFTSRHRRDFFCRSVSCRRCVDLLPPGHTHVCVWKERVSGIYRESSMKSTLFAQHVYVWEQRVGGCLS